MNQKHRDSFRILESFNNPTLVVCPKCGSRAKIEVQKGYELGRFSPRELACESCTYRDYWNASSLTNQPSYEARDDYFNLPLWLQTNQGRFRLWAYNREHLNYLRSFVDAKLRERLKHPTYGWSNQSLTSRLPTWFKSRKNRAVISRGLNKLVSKLENS